MENRNYNSHPWRVCCQVDSREECFAKENIKHNDVRSKPSSGYYNDITKDG